MIKNIPKYKLNLPSNMFFVQYGFKFRKIKGNAVHKTHVSLILFPPSLLTEVMADEL